MKTQERYVEKFYGYLADGKLMGQKCNDCGSYRLAPVPVCENCQSTNLSWTELSKEGKLLLFTITTMPPARFASLAPCAFGSVQVKEGPVLWTLIEGIDIKNPTREFDRLPMDVDIVIKELAGNHVPTARVR
jgi:uncharacterized OB-fold protein